MFIYEYDIKIRTNDLDKNDHLTPKALLSIFQDAAGEHALKGGFGYEESLKQNVFWMVVRNKIELFRQPEAFEILHIVTWPEKSGRIETNRNYKVLDKNGNIVAQGISKWVNVDVNTRRIVRAMKLDIKEEDYVQEKLYDDLPKIEDFSIDMDSLKTIQSNYTDLDHNGHVNNSSYADFIIDTIEELQNKEFTLFEINYIKEMKAYSCVHIGYVREGNLFKVKGFVEDELCFNALVKIKE
ncbi:MAG: acyl-[acyl-carrier-protein] thioesterase [Bacilli bacterium]